LFHCGPYPLSPRYRELLLLHPFARYQAFAAIYLFNILVVLFRFILICVISLNLTFMGPCIVNVFLSITNKMQRCIITYLLTPWSRVLLEKLTGCAASQEVNPHFMEPQSSLPYSQVPATCPYLHNPSPLPENPS
jgi:hypothetical protein